VGERQAVQTPSISNELRPYLSVVVTARNDDHGGNLLRRMQTFVNALLAQARRHAVPIELVVVDWNPPPEKPPLIDALNWPDNLGPVQVRFIEVPPSLHRTYRHAQALPLYQMIAKNVGIRRARGEFILATNIDVIFSHELFELLAQRRLEAGRMYRVDRYDAMQDVPVDGSIDEQLRYCEEHLIRINTRQGSFPVTPTGQRLIEPDDILTAESGISLGRGWYPLEGQSPQRFRWVLDDAEIFLEPRNDAANLVLDVEPGPGVGFLPFALRAVDQSGVRINETVILRRQTVKLALPAADEPSVIRLQLRGGGMETVQDPRILNFRIFTLGWEGSAGATSPKPAPAAKSAANQQPLPPSGWKTLPRRLLHFFARLRSSDGAFQLGVPLPAFLVRSLKPRVEGSAILLNIDPSWFRLRRAPKQRETDKRQITAPGLDLLWGKGWYAPEFFKGDLFRWARSDAEWILFTPQGPPTGLQVLIEPGPAVGYGPFHLQVRDSSGATVATATVHRRQWIDLPLPWQPNRTQVFSLHCRGDARPRPLPNDPRSLYFRVLQCRWAPRENAAPSTGGEAGATEYPCPWSPVSSRDGILLGCGWQVEAGTLAEGLSWRGDPGAEILVQGGREIRGPLDLELEPLDGAGAPLEVVVTEGERTLAKFLLHKREPFRLAHFDNERTTLLRLTAARAHRAPDAVETTSPLRLVRATWGIGGGSRRTPDAGSAHSENSGEPAPAQQPVGAVYLHTNACGDFTLLAREHWLDLRGYPEFDLFSMNIDSVFCFAAHHGGAPEEFLPDPMRIYHIEHATGSGFTPEGQAKLFERIAAKGMSWITYQQVLDWASQMRSLERPIIFNGKEWGFAGIELPERSIAQPLPSARTHSAPRT